MSSLDLPTLFAVSVFVAALLGALLVGTWLNDRAVPALGAWGAALAVGAPAFLLRTLRGVLPDLWTIDFANVALLAAFAAIWGATRHFGGRRIAPALLFAPLLPWVGAAALVPAFEQAAGLRVVLFGAIAIAYSLATAAELWAGRAERLRSRNAAIAVLLLHAAWFAARIVLCLAGLVPGQVLAQSHFWLALSTFEGLVLTVVLAFLGLSLAKEREEGLNRVQARTDPLTGAANRRAFTEEIAALTSRGDAAKTPVALLLFDLDSFKAVNDTWGHPFGDRMLRLFTECAGGQLRAGDVFSRLGGEEFAAVVAGVGRAEALAIAERIRAGFAAAGAMVDGKPAHATVSVGVATRRCLPERFDELFDEADRALYLAKASGRDRVRLARAGDAARCKGRSAEMHELSAVA